MFTYSVPTYYFLINKMDTGVQFKLICVATFHYYYTTNTRTNILSRLLSSICCTFSFVYRKLTVEGTEALHFTFVSTLQTIQYMQQPIWNTASIFIATLMRFEALTANECG